MHQQTHLVTLKDPTCWKTVNRVLKRPGFHPCLFVWFECLYSLLAAVCKSNSPSGILCFFVPSCSRMQSVAHTSPQTVWSLYSNTASLNFCFFIRQSILIRLNSMRRKPPRRPEIRQTRRHNLEVTPRQLATTNWEAWRRCMVWTWQAWTLSPGLLLYISSSGG